MRLFRDQAVRRKLEKPSGMVLHCSSWTRPVATASLVLGAGLLALIVFGHYTRAVAISGYLVPDGGILRVFAPQPGVIVEKRIKAGDHVVKGQTLFVLSADREGRDREPLCALTTETLHDRRARMADTIEKTRSIQAAEIDSIKVRQQDTVARRALLDEKIKILERAIDLRASTLERKKLLADRKLLTADDSEQAELGLLDQRAQLSGLQLDRATLSQELRKLSWKTI